MWARDVADKFRLGLRLRAATTFLHELAVSWSILISIKAREIGC